MTAPDPLRMALNCVQTVLAAAEFQAEGDTDPHKRLLATVHHVGAQGQQAAQTAGQMALVSIAADMRRLADHFCSHGPPDTPENPFGEHWADGTGAPY